MVVSGDGEATCHLVVVNEFTGETTTAPLVPANMPMLHREFIGISKILENIA